MSSDQGLSIFDEEPESTPDLDAEVSPATAGKRASEPKASADNTATQVMPTVPKPSAPEPSEPTQPTRAAPAPVRSRLPPAPCPPARRASRPATPPAGRPLRRPRP